MSSSSIHHTGLITNRRRSSSQNQPGLPRGVSLKMWWKEANLKGWRPSPAMLEMISIVHLGLGTMLMDTGFETQAFLVEPALHAVSETDPGRIDPHAGYYGQALLYAFYTFANLLAPLVIRYGNSRWAVFLGSVTVSFYLAGFLNINSYYFYATSALTGAGFAVFYAGQGVYLTERSSNQNIQRNSGILIAVTYNSMTFGGIILLAIFALKKSSQGSDLNESTIKLLYGAFLIVSIASNFLFAVLPRPTTVNVTEKKPTPLSFTKTITSQLALMKTRNMAFLSFCFIHMGVSNSFLLTVYPTCIAFTKTLDVDSEEIMAFYAFAVGSGAIAICLLSSYLSKKIDNFGMTPTMCIGGATHLLAFGLIFASMPQLSSIRPTHQMSLYITPNVPLVMFCAFLLGAGIGCWNTVRCNMIASHYKSHLAQAFSISKFYQALFCCLAFYLTPLLHLHWQLLFLSVNAVLAIGGFLVVYTFSDGGDNRKVKPKIIEALSLPRNESFLETVKVLPPEKVSIDERTN